MHGPVSPQDVCQGCLSGGCCASEDPITLTAFDILRLSTFFDLSPAQWMLRFTQDRFEGEDSEAKRRPYLDDPESSAVTWLRRRANLPSSPCIFLKYIREEDGTPRRVCGVHEARPLACREYYFDTCRTRWTGELANLHAYGYEKVRDGEIDAERVDAELARLGSVDSGSAPMSIQMDLAFWVEMRRVLDIESTNAEGARSFEIAAYQDSIDEKVNRMLSRLWLRLEEKYGPVPWGEQLHPYRAGLSFKGSEDWQRLMRLSEEAPGEAPLFAGGDYAYYVAARAAIAGMGGGKSFARLPAVALEGQGEVMQAALKACDALVRFAGFIACEEGLLELAPRGTLERELLFAIRRIEAMQHPAWDFHPGLSEVNEWASTRVSLPVHWQRRLRLRPRGLVKDWLRTQGRFGMWHENPAPGKDWPATQGDFWLRLLRGTSDGIVALDPRRVS